MSSPRQPHAQQNLHSRRYKGLKIERLLGLRSAQGAIRMLEVGTGSGGISHYFATHPELECEVHSVDVNDVRAVYDGFHFHRAEGTTLPFEADSFDVVISNHVIEHVGDAVAQRHHLAEIWRVMKPEGVIYLAVPNRWMLVEPHYKLIFLSWLPRSLRSRYLFWRRNKPFYDCEPLSLAELERMLRSTSFSMSNLCVPALRETLVIENMKGLTALMLGRLPDRLLNLLKPAFPTLIYALRKEGASSGAHVR